MNRREDKDVIEERVRKAWNEMACAYDKFTSEAYSYARMIERPVIMRLAGDVRGKHILDLGCGSGEYAIGFAKEGAIVTGLDISDISLGIAREKAIRQNLDIQFIQGSISSLSIFKAKTFDIVFSSSSMHYVADLEQVFRQSYTLIVDDGSLLLSVVHPFYTAGYPLADYTGADKYAVFQIRYFNHGLREYIPPWAKYGPVEKCISYHYTVDDYFSALRKAGFIVDRLVEPKPLPELRKTHPRRYYEMMNIPVFMVFRCLKSYAGQ